MCLPCANAHQELESADLQNDKSELKFAWDQLQNYKDTVKKQIDMGTGKGFSDLDQQAVESWVQEVDNVEISVNAILNPSDGIEIKLLKSRSKRERYSLRQDLSKKVGQAHGRVMQLILESSNIDKIIQSKQQKQQQQRRADLQREQHQQQADLQLEQQLEQPERRQELQQEQSQQQEDQEQEQEQQQEQELEQEQQPQQQQEEEGKQKPHQEQQQLHQQPQQKEPQKLQPTKTNGADNELIERCASFGYAYGFSKSAFSFEELKAATENFNEANILGEGGYGIIYLGILQNKKVVAVKRHRKGAGERFEQKFFDEIEAISRIHHRNIVTLVGYCITKSEKMLVYEYISNKTLAYHLHGEGKPTMDWPTRRKIAIGCAKGLAYLHEDCNPAIMHRDIKSSNILLDDNFEAKVADFGLVKYFLESKGHVSTLVAGTFGYMDPEYVATGQATIKSDVYSFGVLLLELISGRTHMNPNRTYPANTLVGWARPALESRSYDELIDPKLKNNCDKQEMADMILCAAACVRKTAVRRPNTSKIVRILEGATPALPSLSIDGVVTAGHSAESSNGNGIKGSTPFYSLTLSGHAHEDNENGAAHGSTPYKTAT